jgi:hypothetical protein
VRFSTPSRFTSSQCHFRLICRLPYELLARILEDVEPTLRPQSAAFEKIPGDFEAGLQWVLFSHVCARWRSIVLDLASVAWARHAASFRSPAARAAILRRARGAPLEAVLRITAARPDDRVFADASFLFLRAHLPRMRRLELALPERALPALGALASVRAPLPELQTLRVELDGASPGVRTAQFRRLPVLDAPALRSVTLRDCLLFFCPTPALRALDIDNSAMYRGNADGAVLAPGELLSMLAGCPNLTVLRLAHVIPQLDEPGMVAVGTQARIALPRLESLEVVSTARRAAALLARLDVPVSARVSVHVFQPDEYAPARTDTDLAAGLLMLCTALHRADTRTQFDVHAAAQFSAFRCAAPGPAPAGELTLYLPHIASALEVCGAFTHCAVPVRELHLQRAPYYYASFDAQAVCTTVCDALEKLLCPAARSEVHKTNVNVALTGLHVLTLNGLEVHTAHGRAYEERMRALARRRVELGIPIEEILLRVDDENVLCFDF